MPRQAMRAAAALRKAVHRAWVIPTLLMLSLDASFGGQLQSVRRFTSCQDAATYSAVHPALAQYSYRLSTRLWDAHIVRTGRAQFEGHAKAIIYLAHSRLLLPNWTWPGMSMGQRSAYSAFILALRHHELGHAEIAQKAVSAGAVELTVVASSRAQAERALRVALATQAQTASEQLLRQERLYDRVTDHGKRQAEGPLYGFPGGDDVEFSCP
ncbi:MAG: DUF922 domain-containing protein [Acidobacteriaceae bacterium]|nr:DUF922 domain-containing protein [Acidobacteriaceae bacterium]